MAIKKAFLPVHTILATALTAKKVSQSVFDEVEALMQTKQGGGGAKGAVNFLKDVKGNIVAIKCYYFKQWLPTAGANAVEFGKKASSPTGLSTTSKEGTKLWNAALNKFNKAKEQLIEDVAEGKVPANTIKDAIAKLEKARATVAKHEHGFDNKKDLIAKLKAEGIEVAQDAQDAPDTAEAPKAG